MKRRIIMVSSARMRISGRMSVCSVIPFSSAGTLCSSAMIWASSLKLISSQCSFCFPLSALARVRSWLIRADIFRACPPITPMHPRSSSGGVPSWEAYSHWDRMTATGVRSSWETSEVNCFSFSKEASSRSIIWSKVCARTCTSSCPGPRRMRRVRSFPCEIVRAVSVMADRGRSALAVMR